MFITAMNKKVINILLLSSAGLFFLEIILSKFGFINLRSDNHLFLPLFILPPLLAAICFCLLFYNKWFKENPAGILGYLMRSLFCVLAFFMLAIWTVLIIKFLF